MMDVVIIGAGGAGREAYWVFLEANEQKKQWNVLGFVDEDPELQDTSVCGLPVLGNFGWFEQNVSKNFAAVCPVGNPQTRRRLVRRAERLGVNFCTAVHPSVKMSPWMEIGPGSIVCAGAILTTHVQIAAHVVVNIGCTISHDSRVGAYSNINPGCHIAGAVRVGDGVDLGAGAVVIQNKKIGEWSIVGAGAVVTADVPAYVTAVGVPCRVIKAHRPEVCFSVA